MGGYLGKSEWTADVSSLLASFCFYGVSKMCCRCSKTIIEESTNDGYSWGSSEISTDSQVISIQCEEQLYLLSALPWYTEMAANHNTIFI
mmetsp:Transcript_53156/g.159086  ORF Transcript_53156/g.159086 Transcript_53156/m.159086 type:complete len:90 (-) Transcript_53156:22-291(-)